MKEEASQSSVTVIQAGSQSIRAGQDGLPTPHSPMSPSNVQQCLEPEAVDPKIVSIANRVAEIVYSWPPPEEHPHGRSLKFEGEFVLQGPQLKKQGFSQPRAASAKKGKLPPECLCWAAFQAEAYKHLCNYSAQCSAT